MPVVSVINLSTAVSDDAVSEAVIDLQTQVARDFASHWAIDATLRFRSNNVASPKDDSWWLVILDDADQANAVGYHDLTPEGLPLGKVFARTDAESGHHWTVTASHELLEMLADPWLNRCCLSIANGTSQVLACEVSDPCEDDGFGYMIGKTLVSDFVFPGWFDAKATGSSFDFCGHISTPLQILPGGYIGAYDRASGWTQLRAPNASKQFEKGMIVPRQDTMPFGTRRERRARKDLGIPLLRSGAPVVLPSAKDFTGLMTACIMAVAAA